MNLNSAWQEPLIIEMFLQDALCVHRFHSWSSRFWSKQGCQGRWPCPVPSFLFSCQGYLLVLLPVLPPSLLPALGPTQLHLFHQVLQPTGFGSSFSFVVSNQKSGLIILGLVDVSVPSLPRKEVKSSDQFTFPLGPHWGDPGLGCWGPFSGCLKILQERSSWAYGNLHWSSGD